MRRQPRSTRQLLLRVPFGICTVNTNAWTAARSLAQRTLSPEARLIGVLLICGMLAGCSAGTSSTGSQQGSIAIKWAAPAAVPAGTVLGSAQLDATANVPGSFTYKPAAGTVMTTAGTVTLNATFTPTDASLGTATASVKLQVNAATGPTIAALSTTQGSVGTPVVISGVDFGASKGAVQFGSTDAAASSWSETSIATTVPNVAAGSTKVTVSADSDKSNASNFTVLQGQNVCGTDSTVSLGGGAYTYEQDEWNSSLQQCATVNGNSFVVTAAAFNLPTNGPPATYPSIFVGCDWSRCTNAADTALPLQAGRVASATTSVTTQSAASSGAYNVAYNLWFNQAPTADGQPDGGELMVWLNNNGGVQPYGSQTATATIAGASWDVWTGTETSNGTSWKIVTYVRNPGASSASGLDLQPFMADAIQRGSLNSSWYLIEVQMGFEIWTGGIGLGVDNLSINVTSK